MSKQELINDFNEIFRDMVNNISVICPTSVLSKNINDINNAFIHLSPKNKTKFIEGFILKVLKYKAFIDDENEEYFFREIEKDEFKNQKDIKTHEINLFELKKLWCKLKQEEKNLIFQYLQSLCAISNDYLLS